jgi:allophanate hydrolase
VQAFAAFYRLQELRRTADALFAGIDALLLPTAPRAYTVHQVLADPIRRNSRLGTYTNFVNLLDLCALAVPSALADDGVACGVTLVAPAGADARLAAIGRTLHAQSRLPLGATGKAQPELPRLSAAPASGELALAVVGAHLSGMPLHRELQAVGARLLETTCTAPDYRLFALPGPPPAKPGLLRVADGTGAAIAVEVWSLRAEAFGTFVGAVPAPLSIGTLRLAGGRRAKGFLVEAVAVEDARDISCFGGWRAFVAQASTHA